MQDFSYTLWCNTSPVAPGPLRYPQQLMLRVAQVNMATMCKDHLDTWVGFAALGVLQGSDRD